MKYSAKQLHDGRWAVFCGSNKFFSKSVVSDQKVAESDAARRSAIWYLEQAEKAMMDVGTEEGIWEVAQVANRLARDVASDRMEKIGAYVDPRDPYAYLA